MIFNTSFNRTAAIAIEFDPAFDIQDEEFVPDHRAGLTPSEVVQSKFIKLMSDMPVPISCMHIQRDTRRALPLKG